MDELEKKQKYDSGVFYQRKTAEGEKQKEYSMNKSLLARTSQKEALDLLSQSTEAQSELQELSQFMKDEMGEESFLLSGPALSEDLSKEIDKNHNKESDRIKEKEETKKVLAIARAKRIKELATEANHTKRRIASQGESGQTVAYNTVQTKFELLSNISVPVMNYIKSLSNSIFSNTERIMMEQKALIFNESCSQLAKALNDPVDVSDEAAFRAKAKLIEVMVGQVCTKLDTIINESMGKGMKIAVGNLDPLYTVLLNQRVRMTDNIDIHFKKMREGSEEKSWKTFVFSDVEESEQVHDISGEVRESLGNVMSEVSKISVNGETRFVKREDAEIHSQNLAEITIANLLRRNEEVKDQETNEEYLQKNAFYARMQQDDGLDYFGAIRRLTAEYLCVEKPGGEFKKDDYDKFEELSIEDRNARITERMSMLSDAIAGKKNAFSQTLEENIDSFAKAKKIPKMEARIKVVSLYKAVISATKTIPNIWIELNSEIMRLSSVEYNEEMIGLDIRADLSARNAVTGDVADLFGMSELVAHSKVEFISKGASSSVGISMEMAEGIDYSKLMAIAKYPIEYDPKVLLQLSKIQLLDNICGQHDRHLNNMMYKYEEKRNEKGKLVTYIHAIKGIDNEMCFGKDFSLRGRKGHEIGMLDPEKEADIISWPHVSQSMYDTVMGMTADSLRGVLLGKIENEYIDAAIKRFLKIQQAFEATAKTKKNFVVSDKEFVSEKIRKSFEDAENENYIRRTMVQTARVNKRLPKQKK